MVIFKIFLKEKMIIIQLTLIKNKNKNKKTAK